MPADGPDFSRIFVFRLPVNAPAYVKGLEFRPGNAGVVHHANIRIDRDAALAGTRRTGSRARIRRPASSIGRLSGRSFPRVDTRTGGAASAQGARVATESRHGSRRGDPFRPERKSEAVQPDVGLYFTDEPPDAHAGDAQAGTPEYRDPGRREALRQPDSFVLPVDVDVQAVQPHAHYRAREVRAQRHGRMEHRRRSSTSRTGTTAGSTCTGTSSR